MNKKTEAELIETIEVIARTIEKLALAVKILSERIVKLESEDKDKDNENISKNS
jgi:hypothetical protein